MSNSFRILDDNGTDITEKHPEIEVSFLGDGASVTIFKPGAVNKLSIQCGSNVQVRIEKGINVHNTLTLNLRAPETSVTIGRNFTCLAGNILYGDERGLALEIGSNCLFGYNASIRAADGHTVYDITTGQPLNKPPRLIKIEDHVWLGRNVTILKGAHIAKDSIVGMGSVVTKRFTKPNCTLAGTPARIVRTNVNWAHENSDVFVPKEPVSHAHREKVKSRFYKFLHFYWLRGKK